MTFISLFVCLLLILAGLIYFGGPRFAIGAMGLIVMLTPKWVMFEVADLPIDLRMSLAVVCLCVVLCQPRLFFSTGLLPFGFYFADVALISIAVVQCLSDWIAGGSSWGVLLRSYGEWCVPYFVGRFAIASMDDAAKLVRVGVIVSTLLAGAAISESVTRTNPFEAVAGDRPEEMAYRGMHRFGIKRAFGPTMHPIFLGVVFLLLLPWQVGYACTTTASGSGAWKWSLPLVSMIGIACTTSRGPMFCAIFAMAAVTFLLFKKMRKYMLAMGGCAVILVAVFWQQSFQSFIKASSEERQQMYHTVEIDGKQLPYSSTMSRVYAFRLFRPALLNTGLFGYGTEKVTGFPIREVPIAPENLEALETLKTVENNYLLIALRLGWLGLIAFTAFTLSLIAANVLQLKLLRQGFDYMLIAIWAGVMTSMIFCISTVWMPHDFGFLYLYSGGIVASLYAYSQRPIRASRPPLPKKELPPERRRVRRVPVPTPK